MKRHLVCVFLVIFACFCFIFHERNSKRDILYKVLDVDNCSRVCIDINSDFKCNEDEYFYLKYISLYFEGEKHLTKAANDFLKQLLKNKQVSLMEPVSPFSHSVKIALDGVDVAHIVLKKGFATAQGKNVPSDYVFWENVINLAKNRKIFEPKILHKTIDKREIIENKNPDFVTGPVALYLINPLKYPLPSKRARTNLAQSIIFEINNAKSSVYAAIYGIEQQEEILSALIKAKERGVDVKIVCDSAQGQKDAYSDTYKLRKYLGAKSDNSPFIMHNKFFIFDKQKVLTTTANMSSTGVGGYNSNTGILTNSGVVARVYVNEFEQMYSGHFHKDKTKFELVNFIADENTLISVYFSPVSNILEPVLNVIKNSEKEILVSAFYLTHREIISELINAKKRNVDVIVTIDALGVYKFKERIELLKQNNIKVKAENWGGKNHQKNLLSDRCTFISGSANFSKNAVIKNDENMLIIKNCALGEAYRDYYFKLYNSIDDKFLFKYPHAEGFDSGNSCYDGVDNDFDGKIDKDDEGCKK